MPLYHITYRDRFGKTQICRQHVPGTNNPTRERTTAIREAKFRPGVTRVESAVRIGR